MLNLQQGGKTGGAFIQFNHGVYREGITTVECLHGHTPCGPECEQQKDKGRCDCGFCPMSQSNHGWGRGGPKGPPKLFTKNLNKKSLDKKLSKLFLKTIFN